MLELRLPAVLKLVSQYLPGEAGKSVRTVLEALTEDRVQLKPSRALNVAEYRVALAALIGGRSIRFLSIKSLPLFEDADQVEEYAEREFSGFLVLSALDASSGTRNADIEKAIEESRIFITISDAIDHRSHFLERLEVDDTHVSSIAGTVVQSILEEVLQQGAGEQSYFPDPAAALTAASQWTPVAISETEVLVLVE